MGVALAVLFAMWFGSGIVMMYRSFPEVGDADRLQHAASVQPSLVRFTAAAALARRGESIDPDCVRLNTFDGRPVYRFRIGGKEASVYADTGERPGAVTSELADRAAAAWSGLAGSAARVEWNREEDQWTVPQSYRRHRPMRKYSYPDGQQLYVSSSTGEVVQYTTANSRFWAWAGAIPHWLYFTALRKDVAAWSQVVIWSSGIGAVTSLIGLLIGLWMLVRSGRYRYGAARSRIPYAGQTRWHTIFGLLFGVTCATWTFSGMLSMDPFPVGGEGGAARGIAAALEGQRLTLDRFAALLPADALWQVDGQLAVKELRFVMFGGEAFYLAVDGAGTSRIVAMDRRVRSVFDAARIMDLVRGAVGREVVRESRIADEYDLYYLDRTGRKPLPVVIAQLNDAGHTRVYIDPKTGRAVGSYGANRWVTRWLYHGLHSLDFPWLYQHRPLWDVVVLTLLFGGLAICVTALILSWRVLACSVLS